MFPALGARWNHFSGSKENNSDDSGIDEPGSVHIEHVVGGCSRVHRGRNSTGFFLHLLKVIILSPSVAEAEGRRRWLRIDSGGNFMVRLVMEDFETVILNVYFQRVSTYFPRFQCASWEVCLVNS